MCWNKLSVPKYYFICWLAMQQRLQTTERSAKIGHGVCSFGDCLLCGSHIESHTHLFFECHYSMACLQNIAHWLKIKIPSTDLIKVLRWFKSKRMSKFRREVGYVEVFALIYTIWQRRNDSFSNHKVLTLSTMIKSLKIVIRYRIIVVLPQKNRLDSKIGVMKVGVCCLFSFSFGLFKAC